MEGDQGNLEPALGRPERAFGEEDDHHEDE